MNVTVPCAGCGTEIERYIGDSDINAEFCGACNERYYAQMAEDEERRQANIDKILEKCTCDGDGPCGACVKYASVKFGIEI